MMYTKVQFGLDLKKMLQRTQDPYEIGRWAFSAYWENIMDIEDDVIDIALTLNTMEDGPEFARTQTELEQIANDLIAGKDVHC